MSKFINPRKVLQNIRYATQAQFLPFVFSTNHFLLIISNFDLDYFESNLTLTGMLIAFQLLSADYVSCFCNYTPFCQIRWCRYQARVGKLEKESYPLWGTGFYLKYQDKLNDAFCFLENATSLLIWSIVAVTRTAKL